MKNLTWQNPEQLFVAQELINKVKSKCCGIKGDKDLPRFQFPKGSTCQVFNLPVLETLESGDELWITEGVSDCLAMLSAGKKGYCDTICHASEAENGGNDKELC